MKLKLTYNLIRGKAQLMSEIIKSATPLRSFGEIGSCFMTEKSEKIICFMVSQEEVIFYIIF